MILVSRTPILLGVMKAIIMIVKNKTIKIVKKKYVYCSYDVAGVIQSPLHTWLPFQRHSQWKKSTERCDVMGDQG